MSPLHCVRAGGDEVQINSPGFSCGQRKQLSQSPGFRRVQSEESQLTVIGHIAHLADSIVRFVYRNQLEKLKAANDARPVCLC